MPPLVRRSPKAALPTLLSLSKLVGLVPRAAQQWSAASGNAPIEPEDPPDSPVFWWKLGLSAVLVLAGGCFAGLTLALMGSDDLNLRVLSTSSTDPKERQAANKVLRLLSRGRHWVLVVLLLSNVIVNESLPIFLDDVLGGGLYAVIVSTTMIVIFGEIIPQAASVCVRYGLFIGGTCAPVVWAFMILFAPIAWPTAKLLDYVLGTDEGHTYKKAELKSFLQFHREGEEPLRDDEIAILNGVLSLNDKHASEIMTPMEDCLILPADRVLGHEAIDEILLSGFSRIPVHEPGQKDNFAGMLLVKKLVSYNPEDEWPVSKFQLLPLPEASPNINCFQALDYFQTGRAHLLLISDTPGQKGGALGIVSLEDLIEEIIGEEIVDETDRYEDNHSKKAVKRAGTAAVMRKSSHFHHQRGIIERRRVLNAFSRVPSRGESQTPQVPPGGPSSSDGILVQINDGALVAEPVGLSENGANASVNPAKRLVISTPASGHMSPITEGSSPDAVIPELAKSLLKAEENAQANGEGNGTRVTRTLDERGQTEMFPDHRAFEKACRAMVSKYQHMTGTLGPQRTNRGWQWKEHKWMPNQGYLYRHLTCYVSPSSLSSESQPLATDSTSERDLEEEDMEEADDTALLAGEDDKPVKVDIEQHIVFSATYRVPMYCFRAWDETGAPLSIASLLKLNILHPDTPAAPLQFGEYGAALDTLMLPPDPSSPMTDEQGQQPFPLVQSTEHPTTGQLVFSVHPCKVGGAVDEVLVAECKDQCGDGGPLAWLEVWMMLTGRVADLRCT
ncbi:hemolysin [Cryptococcus wingfieldii CBS 7118]|uniref:Hemolysin n=1 Tax=Cryptococcus wingfieldii CBS 7118 TaxID=1295528 RepID=A0A1E3I168_9TREE|nr:hemolysin [Cryptococcus wingfieldii CBS 7118]ODN82343.1 hemolysin [Cryptococcus wingfieldii CBS 7118]